MAVTAGLSGPREQCFGKGIDMRRQHRGIIRTSLLGAALVLGMNLSAAAQADDLLVQKVSEAKDYELVYSLDLAKASGKINYDIDKHAEISGAFDRVAYFLELQQDGQEPQFVYVSMDAFTDDIGKIGIPTVESKVVFQQKIANMNVVSNAAGVTTGTGLQGGNIEFWGNNYDPKNSAKVEGASDGKFDFGDNRSSGGNYGCMQVHNAEAKQTIFAFNHWVVGGSNSDLGIGNSTQAHPDWTFSKSAKSYSRKILRVLVRPKK
jgi:sialate O-acetylesterase